MILSMPDTKYDSKFIKKYLDEDQDEKTHRAKAAFLESKKFSPDANFLSKNLFAPS